MKCQNYEKRVIPHLFLNFLFLSFSLIHPCIINLHMCECIRSNEDLLETEFYFTFVIFHFTFITHWSLLVICRGKYFVNVYKF